MSAADDLSPAPDDGPTSTPAGGNEDCRYIALVAIDVHDPNELQAVGDWIRNRSTGLAFEPNRALVDVLAGVLISALLHDPNLTEALEVEGIASLYDVEILNVLRANDRETS